VTGGVVHGRNGIDRERREEFRVDAGRTIGVLRAGERLTFPQEWAGLCAIEPYCLNFEIRPAMFNLRLESRARD
jgi:hypothetical protein